MIRYFFVVWDLHPLLHTGIAGALKVVAALVYAASGCISLQAKCALMTESRSGVGLVRKGIDVEKQLSSLSTYLGRTCVRDTYWYLSACPEVMDEAARRLDRRYRF